MKREIRNFAIRPFTADDMLNFRSIVQDNEYRLPESLKGWTVMDVGAHIGCFALASYLRGADRIFSYEVEEGNYDALVANATMMAPHVHHGPALHRLALRLESREQVREVVRRRRGAEGAEG